MRKLPPILFLFLITLLFTGCALLENLERGPSQRKGVTITRSAASDLGQVLVFARDEDNKEILFVKEFFSSMKSADTMDKQIRRYRHKMNKFRNRKVTITYHENRAGNLVIEKITR